MPDEGYFGYVMPDVFEGFAVTDYGSDSRAAWIVLENGFGAAVYIDIGGNAKSILNADTEDADYIEQISIHGYPGLLVGKNDTVHIVWGDTDRNKYVSVMCINLDKDTAIAIANSIRPMDS